MKRIPFDEELERAILSSAFYGDVYADQVALQPDDLFWNNAHKTFLHAIRALRKGGVTVDMPSIVSILKEWNVIDKVGGVQYVLQIIDTTPTPANLDYYITKGKDLLVKRRLIGLAESILTDVEKKSGGEALVSVMESIEEIQLSVDDRGPKHISHFAKKAKDWVEGDGGQDVTTGFPSLDAFLGPIRPGWLVAIGGYTGQGKSSFALQVAYNIQRVGNVLYFSLEMTGADLFMRLASMYYNSVEEASSFARRMIRRIRNLGDVDKLNKAVEDSQNWKIYIDEEAGLGVDEILMRSRNVLNKFGVSAIVIDHANLVSAKGEGIVEQMNKVYDGAQRIAHSLKVPVFLVCQYHKMAEGIPDLRHFYGSVKLAQNSDLVLALETKNSNSPDGVKDAEVHVLKARHGSLGIVPMKRRGLMWFEDSREFWELAKKPIVPAAPRPKVEEDPFAEEF
jgi:replicative DNA helicase